MSDELKIIIFVVGYFLICGILTVATTPIEPHYRWKVYYKPYMLAYPQTEYFRTRFGAKWCYRKWKKDCKWIYINRLKGERA